MNRGRSNPHPSLLPSTKGEGNKSRRSFKAGGREGFSVQPALRSLLLTFVLSSVLFVASAFAERQEQAGRCTCPCPCPEKNSAETHQGTEEIPKTFVIKLLMDVYGPVEFTHEAHTDLVESCATCHHHSPPAVYKPCVGCHPVKASNAAELAVPGVRGAFHRQCRGCHVTWESGPTECVDCHAIRKGPSSFGPP